MSKKNISQKASEIALPIVESKNFELVDVEYVKEGSSWYLRFYIDKEGGITIDDCEMVSHEISKKLDEYDIIPSSYFLEVSSPGLERPLKKDKDFEKYKGETVEVRLFTKIDGKNIFEGELEGIQGDKIVVKIGSKVYAFERQNVSLVKKLFKF